MRRRPLRVAGLAALAALLVLAGCGGDDDSAPATTAGPPITTAPLPATTPVPTSAPASTAPAPTATGGSGTSDPASSVPGTSEPGPATTVAGGPDLDRVRVRLTTVARLREPIALVTRPGDATTLYVAERVGRVVALRGQAVAPVLDITSLVQAGGERGLLGMAFSPAGDFLYVHYSDTGGNTTLAEWPVAPDGRVDAGSRRTVLTQEQPFSNHNGGELTFGPDGRLYLGLGDGGSANDPLRAGLDLSTWLGKILRIDPRPDGDRPYRVPADNPFVGDDRVAPEIWSYGLRNPWRFSFDRATGDLWIGDVGQNALEEVSRSTVGEAAGRGVNFGWSAFEGTARFNADQPPGGAVAPVYEYRHGDLGCSITGGFVYRGAAIPGLQGAYVFGDYCRAGVRALVADDAGAREVFLTGEPGDIVSFGEDAAGELYVLSFDGTVRRLDPA